MGLGNFKGYFHWPYCGWNSLKLLYFFIEGQHSLVMDMGNYLVEARCLVGAKRAWSFSPTGAEFECWVLPGEQTLRNGSWHPKTQEGSCIYLKCHLPFYSWETWDSPDIELYVFILSITTTLLHITCGQESEGYFVELKDEGTRFSQLLTVFWC